MDDPPRSLVIQFLEDADAPCPVCGYQLHGLAAERCSECGTPVHLEVGGPSTSRFLWMAAVFGCAIATAMAALALLDLMELVFALLNDPRRVAMVQAGMVSATELPHWPRVFTIATLLCMLSTMLAFLLVGRRAIARWSRLTRVSLCIVGALAPLWVLGMLRVIVFIA